MKVLWLVAFFFLNFFGLNFDQKSILENSTRIHPRLQRRSTRAHGGLLFWGNGGVKHCKSPKWLPTCIKLLSSASPV